ncbi:phosphatidylinositol N-acetylglucosaminyltransferase subunit A, putative [Entamoeba histolytica HM-1:IMSS-B]|uniref:phosphatidylinositol N-acetylglucosaminyltransferase n=6 Tax=Entamoeba histolytica TaxID=5759 RepID=C4M9H3_ENTH1|nr:Phosphatidylinositol N-acetylglucosaminyltransferase subunit A, putative [Entamoeba histolytica HM-1:IMSS]EMD48752.1 phosphatidylinositol N-acetylglucosaminyltransferase subunit A, putative [Entamoeba histolytica KU27]EMH77314.1 phosphatidylinositol N-acetylglucosaminyltransferase subunit A, putative [Entamoeba histolytica HM-1:IMSS-B]EMS13687.1 phosphatidylinositol N-acetylglucosaminyltransferase subunit A, putative [Entamoeba histolytica HM-3:IMSS]ENY64163.1 phosphatidylinositol N-acetylgl|eukprot:XP_656646.1 Phosphatidylinositol N-acetylglucosaminyltransferase subunit A, putative [Entamoeba histolytica HM-1:IMSS]
MEPAPGCYRICLASDFFYPNMGGVEFHQYQIAHFFVKHGHKVVVITHQYGNRTGVRVLKNGIKVYYLPLLRMFNECCFPTGMSEHALIRNILIREQIQILHAHQSFSAISLESMFFARLLGIRVFLTEHSLFGLKGLASIMLNSVLQYSLANSDGAIAVSHCTKENMCIRAKRDPTKIYVIPNALESSKFQPDISKRDPNNINIVILSRLVYRKGIDLAVGIIPYICSKYPKVNFIVGGNGPMMLNFEEMREKYQLQSRVKLLGAIQHCETRDVLVQGDIFLNCSLTEGFCIAIIEALSCGLHVISTHVGGIKEVLPNSLIKYSMPTVEDLCKKVEEVIPICKEERSWEFHNAVKSFYSWERVATRTEQVYHEVLQKPQDDLPSHFNKMYYEGVYSGPFMFFLHYFLLLISCFLNFIWPKESIEKAYEIPRKCYRNGLISETGEEKRTK